MKRTRIYEKREIKRTDKAFLCFAVLNTLVRHSDEEHPLTQVQIVTIIEETYGIEPNRKTVGDCIRTLIDLDCHIEKTKKGCYLEGRLFEDPERKFLIDFLLTNRDICLSYTRDLVDKLNGMASEDCAYGSVKYKKSARKSENKTFFYTIEVIEYAIHANRQVSLDYGHYGTDVKLHPMRSHVVSPYRLVNARQHYYLISYDHNIHDTRVMCVEKIMNIQVETAQRIGLDKMEYTLEQIAEGIMNNESPYMYSGKAEPVELRIPKRMIDYVVDWFGTDIRVEVNEEDCRVHLNANLRSMKYWALQFMDHVEVLEPGELRDSLRSSISNGARVYGN